MKTVLVTGSTDGIGLETARQLAQRGMRVLVHGRSRDKAERACKDIRGTVPNAALETVVGDLAVMPEVVALAQEVAAKAPALDVLLSNAGIQTNQHRLNGDGFEMTAAVNHLAVFLLTHHLLDAVKRAPEGRIVVVASMVHQSGRIGDAELDFAWREAGYTAYCASKLANVLFTRALAKRLAGTHVTANCLHPGVIATKLLRANFSGGAPVASGARTSVYLATSPDVTGVTGRYFVDSRDASMSRAALDDRLAERLWEASERALAPYLRPPRS